MLRFILLKYYLWFFIMLSLAIGMDVLLSEPSKRNFPVAIAFVVVLTLICGSLHYYYDTKLGPKKRVKNMTKPPFRELKENGFHEYEDVIWGVMNGYTIFVSFVWYTGKPAINVEVLFHPKSNGHFLTLQELKLLRKTNKISNFYNNKYYEWGRNVMGYLMEYNFKPPSYEKVLSKASELTEILMRENLKPISKEETEKALIELREWIKVNEVEQSIT